MSAQTYTEKFNYYLSLFLQELVTIFPEYHENMKTHYSELLELGENTNNNDKYVKAYMSVVKPHHSAIATKDDKLFKGLDEINILQGLDFRNIWTKDINTNTRENIWKYLQTLIVIGKKVVGDDDEINDLLKKFSASSGVTEGAEGAEGAEGTEVTEVTEVTGVTEVTEGAEGAEGAEGTEDEMMAMLKNMSTLTQDPETSLPDTSENEMKNLFEGGIISDIAKELTSELDLDNLDMGNPKNMNEAFANLMGGGAGGGNNFFNLVTKVGEKIQNKVQSGAVQQGDLMKEAQKMMGGLKNPEKMANIMKNKNQQQGGATRDRLKKKLDARRDKK